MSYVSRRFRVSQENAVMACRRRAGLVLVWLIALGFASHSLAQTAAEPRAPRAAEPALAGTNAISGLDVHIDVLSRWVVEFDYFYTGAPYGLRLVARVSTGPRGNEAGALQRVGSIQAERGQHRASIRLDRPDAPVGQFATRAVFVELTEGAQVHASATTAQLIEWPDMHTWLTDRELFARPPAEVLATAVALIDEGDRASLANARRMLERLLRLNPELDAGFVELARIAMKSNWGPEGLRQAEAFLASALGIRPGSVNAKILLGYVYAHQGRHKEAEDLFAQSAAAGTDNLWLWSNWGEVLSMQGKTEQAIEKYRRVLAVPPTNDTNDRARLDAYMVLLVLLASKDDLDGMEALYKQRIADYGQARCHGVDYAHFMLRRRGDTQRAIVLARQAVDGQCGRLATEALGTAQYVAWADAPESQRAPLLNEARIHFPITSNLLYQLAADDRTAATVKKLIGAGEPIDQRDNRQLNALAHALQQRDHAAARRLLSFGARPDALVGPGDMAVALLPLLSGDADGVRLMREYGVDYSKLSYLGRSAADLARELGDRRLLEALGAKEPRGRL